MKEISKEELKKIIENHVHYLNMDVEEWPNMRADLRGADLRGANLQETNLRGANLRGTNLQGADLRGTNLQGADLQGADLRGTNLRGADLRGTNLRGANLRETNLRGADLQGADLRGADLQGADLRGTNLRGANLRGTNLQGADLQGADLRGTNLRGADLRETNLRGADLRGTNLRDVKINEYTCFFALQCPEEGCFIGFKKVKNIIIKLLITDKAKRSSSTSRKCRCSEAKVLSFYDFAKKELHVKNIYNDAYCGLDYVKGKIIQPDSWDEDRWIECGHGIHFFLTFEEAVHY